MTHDVGSAASCDRLMPKLFSFIALAVMKELYSLVVLLALFSSLLADDKVCIPENKSCAACYSALVSQVTDQDENLFNLQNTFFPPEKASPLFVTVYYQYGNRSYNCSNNAKDNSTQVWFWSNTLFYMFQPIHVFQYTSILFSDLKKFYSSGVCLMLDPECANASTKHMRLLTQRVSCIAQQLQWNRHIKDTCWEVVLSRSLKMNH